MPLRDLLDRARPALLPTQVFLGGAAVMALELIGSRLLAPTYGSTLYVWGSLIGVVMMALALGARVGGRFADREPTVDALSRMLLAAGAAVSVLPLLAPWVLDLAQGVGLDLVWGPLVASLVLLGPATFLLGMATPFAVRLTAERVDRVGSTSGNVYALSTAGSIAGTFATAFVLVPNVRIPTLLALVGAVLLAVAIAGIRERGRAIALVGVLALVSPVGADVVGRALSFTEAGLSGSLLHETESQYHQIRVTEERIGGEHGRLRTLVMDGLRHSTTYTGAPNETSTEYVYYFHLGRAFDPDVERVLFIGGGGFSGPKKFLEAYPHVRVDVVEIDPEVVRVAEEYFFAPVDDPRVRVFVEDGRRYLARADVKYDIVVLDAYSKTYVPFHLMTAEFFFELHDVLAPGGVVVSNLIASMNGPASDILKAEVKTMDQAFAETYVFPVRGAGYPFAQNVMVVATDERERSSPERVRELARAAATPAVPELESYAARLAELDTRGAPVLRDDFAPVEMLLNPVTRQPYEGG